MAARTRRPEGGRQITISPEVYERLVAAAAQRMVGHHLLGDRLIDAGLDALPPVDGFGRPLESSG